MNKTVFFAKRAVSTIVVVGTGKIVGDIINNNIHPAETGIQKSIDQVTYKAGAYALGGMIAAKTAVYTDAMIDDIVALFRKDDTVTIPEAPTFTVD